MFVQRVWDVIANLWMRYIIYSKEEPLHKIEWAWWRKEFQDEAGNVSHIHAILRTRVDINNTDGKQALFDKIQGSLQDLVHHQELEDLKQKNIIESSDFLVDIYKNALSYLTHKCHSRCQIPKMSNDGKVEFICKVPDNYLLTTQPQIHSIQPINLPRSPMALAILRRLGLAAEKVLTNNRKEIQITHPQLLMERHVPKCTPNQGKFSPVNTELYVKMPSCQNLQFCTGHTLSMYLTSYITQIDQVSIILIKPPTPKEEQTLRLEHHSLNNTKIRSVNNYHKQQMKDDKRKKKLSYGRAITHMETLTVIFGTPLVYSTREFIHYPTVPREYRACFFREHIKTTSRPQDLLTLQGVTGQIIRQQLNFPNYRCFSTYQITVIEDELSSHLTIDRLTIFSIRPPELQFVRNQSYYLTWFERTECMQLFNSNQNMSYMKTNLSIRISKCQWIDGLNNQILLRTPALELCLEYSKKVDDIYFGGPSAKKNIVTLLQRLWYLYQVIVLQTKSSRVRNCTFCEWKTLSNKLIVESDHCLYHGLHLFIQNEKIHS